MPTKKLYNVHFMLQILIFTHHPVETCTVKYVGRLLLLEEWILKVSLSFQKENDLQS